MNEYRSAGFVLRRSKFAMSEPQFLETQDQRESAYAALHRTLEGRDDLLSSIPGIPAILNTVLGELSQPAEKVDLLRIAELVGRDESLAAQCLRVANSPLFGRGVPAGSVRGAVRTLGITRIRDIVLSSTMIRISRAQKGMDPRIFWKHSLGTAIVSRKLARCVGYDDPEKTYLAGLMHDIGYVVNLVLLPEETKAALERGSNTGIFMGDCEREAFGFTHCESGEVLARSWNFTDDLVEVILTHHSSSLAKVDPALVAIVALADRLCRSADLGMGYREADDPAEAWQQDWDVLTKALPRAASMEWTDFAKDADSYFAEIRDLITAMYQAD